MSKQHEFKITIDLNEVVDTILTKDQKGAELSESLVTQLIGILEEDIDERNNEFYRDTDWAQEDIIFLCGLHRELFRYLQWLHGPRKLEKSNQIELIKRLLESDDDFLGFILAFLDMDIDKQLEIVEMVKNENKYNTSKCIKNLQTGTIAVPVFIC